MYDAMHAVSHRSVPEISKGSSVDGDEESATPKIRVLRRAAVRISWLLVFVLRNTSASVTPLDLPYSAGFTAISRLVTEEDRLTPQQNLKFVCGVPDLNATSVASAPGCPSEAHERPWKVAPPAPPATRSFQNSATALPG